MSYGQKTKGKYKPEMVPLYQGRRYIGPNTSIQRINWRRWGKLKKGAYQP